MSFKIPLHFRTRVSSDGIPSIRLMAWVSLKSIDKNLAPMKVIIDTGSPISMIPFKIWGQALVTMGKSDVMRGVADRPECDLEVIHGEITLSLLDNYGKIVVKDLTIPAFLGKTSEVPFILGMHDFLSKLKVSFDILLPEGISYRFGD